MKATVNVGDKNVEITLTPDQIQLVEKAKIEITDLIKSFEDACEHQNVDVDKFNKSCEDLSVDEIAYRKLKIIIRALNENKEIDWNNSKEAKWYPWFDMRSASGFGFSHSDANYADWAADTVAGSRLSFRSEKLANYAANQFTSIYKEFLT